MGWQQGVNRGAWQADETYNRDDVVHRQVGTELDHWIASATSFNVTPAPGASEWSPLTSNVDVRISPTTGEIFNRGSIISAGAHYWLRTGDNTTEQPTSDPTGWITLDDLQNAAEVATDTSNFNGVLAPGNNSVQSALDVLDDAVNANTQTNLTDATLLEYQINPLGNDGVAPLAVAVYRQCIRGAKPDHDIPSQDSVEYFRGICWNSRIARRMDRRDIPVRAGISGGMSYTGRSAISRQATRNM